MKNVVNIGQTNVNQKHLIMTSESQDCQLCSDGLC